MNGTGPVLFAGGGTGGHVFPMVAVAEALQKLTHVSLLFVGTGHGLEAKIIPPLGHPFTTLEVLPLRGRGALGALKGAKQAVSAVADAMRLVRQEQPSVVFSAGGYAAGPVSLAARLLGIPVAMMEPNSVMGLSNRLLSPFVQRAYTAFERGEQGFAPAVVLRTGVPLRGGFAPREYPLLQADVPAKILILGGSQGARSLNQSIPEALARLDRRVVVRHQCGASQVREVEERYRALGLGEVTRVEGFIENMPEALASADLVVSRSGASAVSEICAVGRPSLLVPYPFAAGQHQLHNALAVAEKGAAVVVRPKQATAEFMHDLLVELLKDAERLKRMAEAAREFGKPHAATHVAEDLLQLAALSAAKGKGGSGSSRAKDSAVEAKIPLVKGSKNLAGGEGFRHNPGSIQLSEVF